MSSGVERLARALQPRAVERTALEQEPATVYEVVTRQMVEDLARDVRDLRRRIDTLLFMVIAAIIVDLALRLSGAGA
jgi:hypothetical protein